ncbi:hypothetical protein HCU40_04935 [Pseudanabaena biceps]|nr:hypothetical protein [Pseudanabaena biceps]
MELLAYIQEEFISPATANFDASNELDSGVSHNFKFPIWLKQLTNKSAKLGLKVILSSTTILLVLGSTLALAEATTPSDVRYVQSLLAQNGFDPGQIDGVAGRSTKNAILRAQRSLGLTTDGIVGSQTIASLEDGITKTKAETDSVAGQSNNAVSSASVMNLQKLLSDRGFYKGTVDGLMGAQTRQAIVEAQKAYNITPDGIAGPRTLAALESDGSKASTAPVKSIEVENLQKLLAKRSFYNGAVDGILGPQTRIAIVAAQRNYGLTADGIAGSQTIAALESNSNNIDRDQSTPAKPLVSNPDQDILALQRLLKQRGFYEGSLDGIKGSRTTDAIAAAQKAYGLTQDGIAGKQTIAALQRDGGIPRASASLTPPPKTIPSVKNNDVANLQNLLTDRKFYSGSITGVLDSRTTEAVIAAQKAYGLTADGIAGLKTIAALEAGAPTRQTVVVVKPSPIITPSIRVETKPQQPAPIATAQPQPAPIATAQPQPTQPPISAVPKATPPAVVATPTPKVVTPPTAVTAPQAAPPQTTASNSQVLELQNLLTKRGFYTGKADGVLTGETRNAIIRAQNFYSISPADGSPSSKLVESLSKDSFISAEGN